MEFFRRVGNFMSKIFTIKAMNFFVITARSGVFFFTTLLMPVIAL